MPNAGDIGWFKQQFAADIRAASNGTPFDVDMLVAIACQETGHIWSRLRRKTNPKLTREEILALCVGDTIDAKPSGGGRRAFPKTKADLLSKPKGKEMFAIAREALEKMAPHVPGFSGAVANKNKFCHGYGVFQYDLQFFLKEPDYFLERRYEKFDQTLGKALEELTNAKKRVASVKNKTRLTDLEFAHVAIAYNTGSFKPAKGLKQGFKNSDGQFYGELIFDFVRLSRTVAVPGAPPQLAPPQPGHAIMAAPQPIAADGNFMRVDTMESTLRLRSAPKPGRPLTRNVVGELPDGHPVRAVSGTERSGFVEVETSLNGAHLRGFAAVKHLAAAPTVTEIPLAVPAAMPPTTGLVAVIMPRKAGTVTKRTAAATAHSLNEPNQPGPRRGATAADLRTELAEIIDHLAVDKASHKRYQPTQNATFCNIYAHDYCHLAGVYLPRVWWTPKAIEKLTAGQTVQPLIGDTIQEMRANDLFRWLRDFGLRFGWRQTGTLDKLQQAANAGGIGVIVARRKIEGRSGHIVIIPPETEQHQAKRNAQGLVVKPLQSQAGSTNFRYDLGKPDWWKGEQFAESAFLIHH
jgi:hypothetical protein